MRWARGAGLRFRPPLAACLLQEVQRLLSRGGEADALPPGPSVPTARAALVKRWLQVGDAVGGLAVFAGLSSGPWAVISCP